MRQIYLMVATIIALVILIIAMGVYMYPTFKVAIDYSQHRNETTKTSKVASMKLSYLSEPREVIIKPYKYLTFDFEIPDNSESELVGIAYMEPLEQFPDYIILLINKETYIRIDKKEYASAKGLWDLSTKVRTTMEEFSGIVHNKTMGDDFNVREIDDIMLNFYKYLNEIKIIEIDKKSSLSELRETIVTELRGFLESHTVSVQHGDEDLDLKAQKYFQSLYYNIPIFYNNYWNSLCGTHQIDYEKFKITKDDESNN